MLLLKQLGLLPPPLLGTDDTFDLSLDGHDRVVEVREEEVDARGGDEGRNWSGADDATRRLASA